VVEDNDGKSNSQSLDVVSGSCFRFLGVIVSWCIFSRLMALLFFLPIS
jgi:hypothetical protein